MTLAPGSALFDEADPAALYVVASGEVTLETEGQAALRAGPGDTLGAREALAGLSAGRARGEAAGVALRLDGEAFLELLTGDAALLQGTFGALLEALRRARRPPRVSAGQRGVASSVASVSTARGGTRRQLPSGFPGSVRCAPKYSIMRSRISRPLRQTTFASRNIE